MNALRYGRGEVDLVILRAFAQHNQSAMKMLAMFKKLNHFCSFLTRSQQKRNRFPSPPLLG